jgi:hypothetical protein
MKKIAILQSNYIPWKGYFDLIASVDEFIIYDDVQYTRRDWRNRNQIKAPEGLQWITIPVKVKGKYDQKISEAEVEGFDWPSNHWRLLEHNYKRASNFVEVSSWLKPLYEEQKSPYLSEINRKFIEGICHYLGITTTITSSINYELVNGKTDRLVNICLQAGASEYITGPSAKSYIDESKFFDNGVKLSWIDYAGYKEYNQLWGNFLHNVSILDLIFNTGKDSYKFMKNLKK